MAAVKTDIENSIKSKKPGKLIFTKDFHHLGSLNAIHFALHHLNKIGLIESLTRGIYYKSGDLPPTLEKIAEAIAEREKARILPSGNYALNKLGISTQVPGNLVLYTDGSPRTLHIGKRQIRFKRTTPKILSLKGELSKLAVLALKEIGQKKVQESEIDRIIEVVKNENTEALLHDIALAPAWIAEILGKALKANGISRFLPT